MVLDSRPLRMSPITRSSLATRSTGTSASGSSMALKTTATIVTWIGLSEVSARAADKISSAAVTVVKRAPCAGGCTLP